MCFKSALQKQNNGNVKDILQTTAVKYKTINYYVLVVIIHIIVTVKQKEMQSLCADMMWLLFIISVSTIAL